MSHRSGETIDSFISDLTVAVNAGHLKTGGGCRGEGIEKINQLIRIENQLRKAAKFAGIKAFKNKGSIPILLYIKEVDSLRLI
ncbi:MAG: enolase, partial [Candidatus Scalindua brodae]